MHVPRHRRSARLAGPAILVAVSPLALLLTGIEACGDTDLNQAVLMRDGVALVTDAYPLRQPGPTILVRTPYGRVQYADYGPAYNLLGYNLVVQDARGTGDSEGEFMMFHDDA